jgi:hypothetical protein
MSSEAAKSGESKRKHQRYVVSEDCRLRAAIKIQSSDADSAKKDWPGTLVDLSASGAHIQISMAAVAYKNDSCVLRLSHGAVKLDMRGVLAHYVCSARYSICGVKFDYPNAAEYQPFLKAIVASSTLKAGENTAEAGGYREDYRGPGETKLVVWRDNKPERAVTGFEYVMGRYTALLKGAGPDLMENKQKVIFKPVPGEGPDRPLSASQEAEARWEFSVAASNLQKVIPPDLRKFLRLVS